MTESMQQLKDAVDTAKAALDACRTDVSDARAAVQGALADVNTATGNRVRSNDPTITVPLDALQQALQHLATVEQRYQIPADDSP